MKRGFRNAAAVGLVAIALLGIAVAAAWPFVPKLALSLAARATGRRFEAERVALSWHHVSLEGLRISTVGGEPILDADRVEIEYRLRDLLFGGPRLFGLVGLDVDRPAVTLLRRKDGSWNVPLPQQNAGSASPSASLHADIRVRDGRIALHDETRRYVDARDLSLEGLDVQARFQPRVPSTYSVRAVLVAGGGRFPLRGAGRLDAAAGWERQHWVAARIPVAPLVNYVVNAGSLHALGGEANGVDAVLVGLSDNTGAMERHLFARARLERGKLQLAGIAAPIDGLRGTFAATDQTLLTREAFATLAGVPLRIAGGIFDLTAPKLRLGIRAEGRVRQFLDAAPAAARLPMRGSIATRILVEGDATAPLTFVHVAGRDIRYAALPFDGVAADVALLGTNATVMHATAQYAGLNVVARGNVSLGKQAQPTLLVDLAAPPHSLPLVDRVAPGLEMHGLALVAGIGTRLGGQGLVMGNSSGAKLAATFRVDGDGNGRVGPLTLDGPHGQTVYARASLHHYIRMTQVVALARGLRIGVAPERALPGVKLPELPDATGEVDLAAAFEIAGTSPTLGAGTIAVRNARYAGISLDAARMSGVAGAGAVAVSALSVRAAWGNFEGRGGVRGSDVALEGRFSGDLATVGALAGQRGLHGSTDVPLRLLAGPHGTVAQVIGATFHDASVNGVPVNALDATVALRGGAVNVYSAAARVRGGTVVAAGSLGNGARLGVSARDIPVAALPGVPSALQGGSITGGGTLDAAQNAPSGSGDAILSGASVRGLPLTASTHASFEADRISLTDASAVAAGAVASADGGLTGLRQRAGPAYAFHATVIGADVPTLAHAAGRPLPLPVTGAADAQLAIAGSGAAPSVSGRVVVAAGSVNGLAFTRASADVAARDGAADIRSGHVTVGSSALSLAGAFAPGTLSGRVRSDRLDLADFNDFFDPGDQLAGTGAAAVAFHSSGAELQTNGHIALEGARYVRYRIGSTRAAWSTAGRHIAATASIASVAGKVAVSGSALIPEREPLRNPLDRLPLDAHAEATGVDLATWLPAAGFYLPVTGKLDAQVRIAGPVRTSLATATLHAHDATIGHIGVQRADVTLHALRGRVTVPNAIVELPALAVTAHGSFGLRPRDPIELNGTLTSPDVGALLKGVSGKTIDAAGALNSQIQITGSAAVPRIANTLELSNARYAGLTIPHALARVALAHGVASLDEARIDFGHGTLHATADAPFDVRHPALSPHAPVAAMLQADHLDLAALAPLLGKGTTLKGTLDGRIDIAGTAQHPLTSGGLELAGGYYASPLLTSPLSNLSAHLALHNGGAQLTAVRANLGRGTIQGAATVSAADLSNPLGSLDLRASVGLSQAEIDAPNYLRGVVDGHVDVARAPRGPILVSGAIALPQARVPLTALYNPKAQAPSTAPPLPLAFDLGVEVGRDVRIQSGQIDVGGQGTIHVGGTLAAPQLAGTLRSTGGSVDFYRSFYLARGSVHFDPANGIMPFVDVVATTRVPDPATDVTLTVSGLAPDNLNVALASNPSYERSQILGLLLGAQQLGAVNGVASSSGSAPTAGQLATAFAQSSLSQQFTRQLLEPLSARLGQTFGLNQFAINYNPQGGFAANARKGIARNIDAVYAETFNYPVRQSLGIEAHPSPATSLQLTFFQQQGTGQFSPAVYASSTNPALTATQPAAGTSGFSFTVQHRFWGGKRKALPSPAPSASATAEAAAR